MTGCALPRRERSATRCPARRSSGQALIGSGGPPGGELEIIGPGKRCPNAAVSWRGWVVRSSSTAQDEHLVLTASLLGA
jgi:hypothetical protein